MSSLAEAGVSGIERLARDQYDNTVKGFECIAGQGEQAAGGALAGTGGWFLATEAVPEVGIPLDAAQAIGAGSAVVLSCAFGIDVNNTGFGG
jgi:hypothetical protein